jgi:uncharacterized protein
MKKFIYTLSALIIMSFTVSTSFAATEAKVPVKKELTANEQVQLQRIKDRVEEIRHADKSTLTKEQRKDLRNELREMKKQANAVSGGGVYLSIGAIIIIILLLILIL